VSRPFYRSELIGKDLIWLLTLNYAGRAFRFSSEPIDVTSDDGTIVFRGGLPRTTLDDSARAFTAEPDLLSVPFRLDMPIDVAAFEARGHSLAAADGELALLVRGNTWENRRVMLIGKVVQPEYGDDDEPIKFSLEQNTFDDTGSTHNAAARVTVTTWPNADATHIGRYYPIVFGTPGLHVTAAGATTATAGTPTSILARSGSGDEDADTLLVAGHAVNATTAKVYHDAGNDDLALTQTTDGLGRTVTTMDITSIGIAASPARTTSEFYIAWNDSSGGGMPNQWGGGELEGAGDVLLWLLSMSTLPVDFGRIVTARGYLNRFKLAGYIDEATTPWAFIQDFILSLLPISVRMGPQGVYVLVWRLDATSADAVDHLTEGPGVQRVGPVERINTPRDVINEFRFDYALSDKSGSPKRSSVLTPSPDASDPEQAADFYAQLSASRYGTAVDSMTSEIIYDEATARLIMAWKMRAEGFLHRTVRYEVPQEYGHLEPGSVVTLTSADLHLTDQVCLVREVGWTDSGVPELDLWLVEDQARDSRESAA
jgi:hypothetical protein